MLPPKEYPITGRFGCVGYDKSLAIPGDLGSITPGTGGANNGMLFVLPSRNVVANFDTGRWIVELAYWNGTDYIWSTPQSYPMASSFYYPEVNWPDLDLHMWASGTWALNEILPAGVITVWSYDGTGVIGGSLAPGSDNGIILSLPINSPHLMVGAAGAVYHGGIWVVDLDGVKRFKWSVWPATICSIQSMTAEWLISITSG